MIINFFYLVDLVINLLIAGGFFYRYKQYHVKYYSYLGMAVLGQAVASGLLAFLTDLFDSTLAVIIVYAAIIVSALSSLVFVLTILNMFQTWIHSMRNAAKPAANKLLTSTKVCRYLRIAYPALTGLMVVFYILIIVTLTIAAVLAMVAGFAYSICAVTQLALTIWLFLDVQNAANESELKKRNQLVRIGAMTFFGAWPSLLAGVGAGVGASVCWWIFFGVALWPNALLAFDEEPTAAQPYSSNMYNKGGDYPQQQQQQQPQYQQQQHYQQQQQYGGGGQQAYYGNGGNGGGGGGGHYPQYPPQSHV